MNNVLRFIITCRFPSWGEDNQYPAFGVKYLIEVPIERDEEWEEVFKEKYKAKIGRGEKDFDGEILFSEIVELVNL